MLVRAIGAALRGLLVAVLIATPALILPGDAAGATEIVALLALLAAGLTFAEYNTTFPSLVEFRDAPPLNRMRYVALALMIFSLTLIAKHPYDPTALTAHVTGIGERIGHLTDFPYSPVRLVLLMLPPEATAATVDAVRVAAGVCYAIAICTVLAFLFSVRVMGWPTGNGAFNVWVNLPLFDPTTGGDVVRRLRRDGRINVVIGFLIPFVIPAIVKLLSALVDPISMADPQTRIWTLSAWAFLPASIMMRGVAMSRIAELIEAKRRRAYARAQADAEAEAIAAA